jgi:hypothetical protein
MADFLVPMQYRVTVGQWLRDFGVTPLSSERGLQIIAKKVREALPSALEKLLAHRHHSSTIELGRDNGPAEPLLFLALKLFGAGAFYLAFEICGESLLASSHFQQVW